MSAQPTEGALLFLLRLLLPQHQHSPTKPRARARGFSLRTASRSSPAVQRVHERCHGLQPVEDAATHFGPSGRRPCMLAPMSSAPRAAHPGPARKRGCGGNVSGISITLFSPVPRTRARGFSVSSPLSEGLHLSVHWPTWVYTSDSILSCGAVASTLIGFARRPKPTSGTTTKEPRNRFVILKRTKLGYVAYVGHAMRLMAPRLLPSWSRCGVDPRFHCLAKRHGVMSLCGRSESRAIRPAQRSQERRIDQPTCHGRSDQARSRWTSLRRCASPTRTISLECPA